MLLLCTAILGGLGPLVVGLLSDALQPEHGVRSLAHAMLLIPASFAMAAACFALAAFGSRTDPEIAEPKGG